MELSCPLGTTRCVPQEKFSREPYNKLFIDQACSIKMAGYGPRSFLLRVYRPRLRLGPQTWPISSHLDRTNLWSVTHISLFFFKFSHLSALNINVTLIDGPGSYAGRVELNYSGSLCDTDLTIDVGHVICRQLGYPQAVAIPCCNAFGRRNNSFWLYDVKCKGNESSLAECDYKVGPPNVCFPSLDFASVVCENPNITDSKFMIKAIKKTGQKIRR